MRALPLEHELFFSLERVTLDVALAEEGYGEFAPVEVETVLDKVNAALMPFEVVKAKQEVYFVVFKDRQTDLDRLVALHEVHVGQVDSAENA